MRSVFLLCISVLYLACSGCAQRYYNVATEKQEIYFYSTEKEVRIGQSLSQAVEEKFKLDDDPLSQQHIDAIGQKLALVNERKDLRYSFKLLQEDKVNAVALPGGFIYIFKELWDKVKESDDAIAAVLAHEIAHVSARHSIKRLQSSMGYGALSVLVVAARGIDARSRTNAIIGINELLLSYSREDELEADALAVKYLVNAGYDPGAIIEVLEILQQSERERPIRPLYVATHPYITERMRTVRERIDKGNIGFDDYINTLGNTN